MEVSRSTPFVAKVELCDESLAFDDPPLHTGDVVAMAINNEPEEGQLCGVVVGTQLLVRHVYYTPGGMVRFEARNLDFPPLWRRRSQVCILGTILSHPVPGVVYEERQMTG